MSCIIYTDKIVCFSDILVIDCTSDNPLGSQRPVQPPHLEN